MIMKRCGLPIVGLEDVVISSAAQDAVHDSKAEAQRRKRVKLDACTEQTIESSGSPMSEAEVANLVLQAKGRLYLAAIYTFCAH